MFWQLCICFIAVYLLVIWWNNRAFRNIYKQIPCSMPAVPILGHALYFFGNAEGVTVDSSLNWKGHVETLNDGLRSYSYALYVLTDVCSVEVAIDRMLAVHRMGRDAISKSGLISMWLIHKLCIVVADPEDAGFLMKTCLEKDDTVNLFKSLIGNGSVFAPVSIWRSRRKMLAPTFKQSTLNSFVKVFSKHSGILTEILKTKLGKDQFSILRPISSHAMDSVCETTLGETINSQNSFKHPILKALVKIRIITVFRLMRPWLWPEIVYKWMPSYSSYDESITVILNFFKKVVKTKRHEIEQKQSNNLEDINNHDEKTQTKTFLEYLLESSDGEKGCDLELQEETLVMVTAGADITAIGAAFVSLILAKFPDVQEKVYQEIQEVLGGSDRPIEAGDLPNLKYLDAVVKETMRLYPPTSFFPRKVSKNVTLPSGITLVPEITIIIHIWALHRNPKYWGHDAEVFRPERFFDSPPTHPSVYVPFGYGPRKCIGYQYALMFIKTTTVALVRKYRLLPRIDSDESQLFDKKDPIRTKFDLSTMDVDNFKLRVEMRR